MSKTLGSILGTFYGPISGFAIGGSKGALKGLANAAAALSGPAAFAAYVGGAIIGSLEKSQRPEQAETAIKPTRSRGPLCMGAMDLIGVDGRGGDWRHHDELFEVDRTGTVYR